MGNEFVSTIQGFIIKDLHESMKNGDDVRRDFLRVILSEFNKIDKILDDSQATEVLVKMRNDNKRRQNAQGIHSKDNVVARNGTKIHRYTKSGYRDWETDRKSTRLNSSHSAKSRMPSSA